jgi:pyruvate dehydrogenase E2 component (dihydrolipoamide acetyltransferase)
MIEVKIPDIGDFDEVEVIEILVNEGDEVSVEDPLLTLESDKATMDIPSPSAGKIATVTVSIGDKVSEGTLVMQLVPSDAVAAGADGSKAEQVHQDTPAAGSVDSPKEPEVGAVARNAIADTETVPGSVIPSTPDRDGVPDAHTGTLPHASPGVRRFARELGADLHRIAGSAAKGRITREDVKSWVKQQLSATGTQERLVGTGIPAIPEIDFSQFGKIETLKLSRIKKLSGPHLQRAWLNIPHVTHHDEADITELEEFRKSLKKEAENEGVRITILSFVMKALVGAMKKYPNFNSSLAPGGESLVLKKYFNVGIAVDTPNGLVVPVVRDVDRKSIFDLARDLADVSERARDGKLRPDDLKGGCISISSLGGIGGTGFTPIVNAPEVAILGVSRSKMTPVWNGDSFDPRLLLPLDLSYDHRVVDGAEAARFAAYLTRSFGDVRRLSL